MRLVGRKERKGAKVQRRKGSGSRGTIKKVSGDSPRSIMGLRGKAHFTHPTEINANVHTPKPLGSSRFQPGGRHFSAGVRKPPDPGNNTTIRYSSHRQASITNNAQCSTYLI